VSAIFGVLSLSTVLFLSRHAFHISSVNDDKAKIKYYYRFHQWNKEENGKIKKTKAIFYNKRKIVYLPFIRIFPGVFPRHLS